MKSIKTPFGLALIVVLVSSACSVPLLPAAAPPATSTPDAMMTALVQTLTAIYAPTDIPSTTPTLLPPTEPPTETPIPFPTITPIPSFTPLPSFTPFGTPPNDISLTLTPGGTVGTAEFKCKLVEKSPDNWTVFKPRQAFDALWKLRNAGSRKWIQGNIVLVYVDGAKFHQGDQKILPIPSDVNAGEESTIGADFIAPKAKGNHVATWGLMENRSKNVFCTLTVMITVK